VLYIDRHLVHEVTSPQAFEGLRLAGRKVWRTELDRGHRRPQRAHHRLGRGLDGIARPDPRLQVATLDAQHPRSSAPRLLPVPATSARASCTSSGPEQGCTLPGMTVVCGD
jgi:3-isopropylmalate/(R)-2-methylmalate dehydratase large subunit